MEITQKQISKNDQRLNLTFETSSGIYRICGFDMLPHKIKRNDSKLSYDRVSWDEFHKAVTKPLI